MVKPTDARQRDHAALFHVLDLAAVRGVAVERHVWSILVVIGCVLADQVEQMAFTKHNHVIEQFATQRAEPSFGVSVLPRRTRSNLELLYAQVFDARVEGGTVNAIAVSNQLRRYEIRANGLDNLLRRPLRVRVRCHVNVQYSAAFERNHEEYV